MMSPGLMSLLRRHVLLAHTRVTLLMRTLDFGFVELLGAGLTAVGSDGGVDALGIRVGDLGGCAAVACCWSLLTKESLLPFDGRPHCLASGVRPWSTVISSNSDETWSGVIPEKYPAGVALVDKTYRSNSFLTAARSVEPRTTRTSEAEILVADVAAGVDDFVDLL